MNRVVPVILLIVLSGYFSSCSLLRHKGTRKHKNKGNDTTQVIADSLHAAVPSPAVSRTDTIAKPVNAELKQLIDRITPFWTNRLVYKTFSGYKPAPLHRWLWQ